MKLVCTSIKCNIANYAYLTINKIYESFGTDKELIQVLDDSGFKRWYYAKNFSPLSNVREEKLEKLGIN